MAERAGKNKSDKMLDLDECHRIISPSKLERIGDRYSRKWWGKIFKMLEDESAIPQDRRLDVLKAIFPDRLLHRILAIISAGDEDKINSSKKLPCERSLIKQTFAPSITTLTKPVTPSISIYSTSEMTPEILTQVGKKNPYLKFFKTRHDRASIWRPMPPLSLEDMNLVQKADAITERIAEDFVKWLQEMGGERTSTLTVATIISMFEIGFNTHAARSLCVRLKEMPTVTNIMAEKRNIPEIAKRASMLRQIHRDIAANKLPAKKVAFGKSLPPYLQRVTNREDIAKKWLICQNVPQKLKTMQTVWEGITHLRSTRAYCEWLLEHPEIDPPQFLKDNNMLDLHVLHTTKFSVDSEIPSQDEDMIPAFQETT